ncbi:LysR family transcriptional regulator [Shewanella sp. Choline-02u-19]|uniref:LysR family transcriptional regulator n=1 Tax=unclassified Shewanella TaxID=196818 RepID=UPI000C336BCB|nr:MULTISPECIES: LysR family transcriptional regulator [unclassified Shewanella]PKG58961.1 LysR family transcriptional regulator [Shewanella sp. GutDb-MelDb]PKG74259.1 LysR family transcriptional regulator [Shewanella sp. GutCb]PKH55912.1 LysR family transcriptional regulator [Shewanella sp. Bg11-22]PKI27358.1 LysR family transcriptional regulator [Shewanella sp. Choline-02u-19]
MDRAKSTLEQWRIIQAVVDYGGYAQAAEKLNKSQSSLNHAVAKLQFQLGVQLLEVKGRKAYLTECGEVLLRRSRHITQSVNELELLANNLETGWEPTLTIAREIIYPMDDLVDVLSQFYPLSRGTRITVIDTVLTGTSELIIDEAVDIAICGGPPPKGHLAEPLIDINFNLVCHPEHPLAQYDVIEEDETLAQHLQIVIKDTALSPNTDLGWLKAEQRWTVTNFHEAIVILKKRMGFCWLPEDVVQSLIENGELKKLHLKGSSKRKATLSLVIPNRDKQGPASELIESLIKKHHLIDTI